LRVASLGLFGRFLDYVSTQDAWKVQTVDHARFSKAVVHNYAATSEVVRQGADTQRFLVFPSSSVPALEHDRLGKFLEERCRMGAELRVATAVLLAAYNEENEDARMTGMGMATAMRGKGFDKRVANCYNGLEYREDNGGAVAVMSRCFKVTGNREDFVLTKQLDRVARGNGMSITALKDRLGKMEGVRDDNCSVRGRRNGRGFMGVRLLEAALDTVQDSFGDF
jgi:hypothetical protein